MHAEGMLQDPVSGTFIQWLHKQFYLNLKESMCQIEKQGRSLTIVPGEYRNRAEQDVSVGLHQPPSSIHVNDFMAYSMERYTLAPMGKGMRIVAMAAAHHRFNYIHPFPDGNGRVSRLLINTGYCGFPGVQFLSQIVLSQTCLDSGLTQ